MITKACASATARPAASLEEVDVWIDGLDPAHDLPTRRSDQ
jgi:hypothetical protein